MCWACGAFSSSSRAVGLRRPCPGVPTAAGSVIIERVAAGKAARWLPDDSTEVARRDREFTLNRALREQAEHRAIRRCSAALGRRLNHKTPAAPFSCEPVRHGHRLTRKTLPGTLTILEPQRQRSAAQFSHLEDHDPPSEAEDGLEVAAPSQVPWHSAADLADALSRDDIWEALNWPEVDPQAEFGYSDDDPFGNGVVLG